MKNNDQEKTEQTQEKENSVDNLDTSVLKRLTSVSWAYWYKHTTKDKKPVERI